MHLSSMVTSNHNTAPLQDFSFLEIYLPKHLLTLLQILVSSDLAASDFQSNRCARAEVVVMIQPTNEEPSLYFFIVAVSRV